MFSSLIFVALAAAWLVVLVPMFARRRQEISRTTDSTLAARVVRRGSGRSPATATAVSNDVEETFAMADSHRDLDSQDVDPDPEFDQDDGSWRRVYSDDVRAGRRYRPGRGGFDPEAAALAARAKYARRQRIVLVMLLAAVLTGVFAAMVTPLLWWAHGGVDLVFLGYLGYLRRQVHIENEVRDRRLARMSREDEAETEVEEPEEKPGPPLVSEGTPDVDFEESTRTDVRTPSSTTNSQGNPNPSNAVVVEIDDEDPMFDELDERTWAPYRKAAGE